MTLEDAVHQLLKWSDRGGNDTGVEATEGYKAQRGRGHRAPPLWALGCVQPELFWVVFKLIFFQKAQPFFFFLGSSSSEVAFWLNPKKII